MAECSVQRTLFQLEVPAIIHTGDLTRKKGGSLKYDLYGKRSSFVDREPTETRSYKWSSMRIGRRSCTEKRESIVKFDTSANGGPFTGTQQPIKVIGKEVNHPGHVVLCELSRV
jgi:hypothetical protein